MKTLWLALCVAGVVVPYASFVPWLAEHGFNASLFTQEMMANRVSRFFAADVVVSAVAVLAFARAERIPHRWSVVLALVMVGVSLALPLTFYLRETSTAPGE